MWKDIRGFEGFYQVSDEGKIRRIHKDGSTKEMKFYEGRQYYTVCLTTHCEKYTLAVHKIVAEMFLPKPVWATEINHKDGNKHNNRVENLEWVSQRQNRIHAINELSKPPYGKKPRKVKCLDINTGKLIAEYPSVSDASRTIGNMYSRAAITQACKGKYNTAYGFRWEYAD